MHWMGDFLIIRLMDFFYVVHKFQRHLFLENICRPLWSRVLILGSMFMYKWNVLNWKKPWEKCQLETVFRCSRLVYHTLVLEKNIMKEFWDFPCWKLIFFLIDLSQPLGPNPSFWLTNVDILWSSSILGDRGGRGKNNQTKQFALFTL